jgi:hypothetical protein
MYVEDYHKKLKAQEDRFIHKQGELSGKVEQLNEEFRQAHADLDRESQAKVRTAKEVGRLQRELTSV